MIFVQFDLSIHQSIHSYKNFQLMQFLVSIPIMIFKFADLIFTLKTNLSSLFFLIYSRLFYCNSLDFDCFDFLNLLNQLFAFYFFFAKLEFMFQILIFILLILILNQHLTT